MIVFAKTFDHYDHKFNFDNFFSCPVKLKKNLKLKFRSKFNHDFTNHGYLLHSAVWKVLYNFKIKESRSQDITNFSFRMFKMMGFLRSSKCSKTIVEITFTAQKANAGSPWTACSVFDWKDPFWVNLVQKLKIVSLSWNFVLRIIQICRITQYVHIFFFQPEQIFWINLIQKVKIASWSWNLVPRLIRICWIQWWCSLFLFLIIYVLLGKIWSKNLKLLFQSEIWYEG